MVVVFVVSLSHQEMSQLELSRTTDIMTTPTTYINSYEAKAALTKMLMKVNSLTIMSTRTTNEIHIMHKLQTHHEANTQSKVNSLQ